VRTENHAAPFFPIHQVDEIAFAMTLFVSAAAGKMPASRAEPWDPPTCECGAVYRLVAERTQTSDRSPEIAAGESTLEFAFMSLWRHYERDHRRQSICARVLGFHSLMVMTRGALVESWVSSQREAPEVVLLHPAVVEAVAMTPLGHSGVMTESEFLRTLAVVAMQIDQAA